MSQSLQSPSGYLPVVAESDRGQEVAEGHVNIVAHCGPSHDELQAGGEVLAPGVEQAAPEIGDVLQLRAAERSDPAELKLDADRDRRDAPEVEVCGEGGHHGVAVEAGARVGLGRVEVGEVGR